MAYEIWSTAPGNLLATYSKKAEALAVVRRAIEEQDEDRGRELALAYENSRGNSRLIAVGEDLIALARASAPTSQEQKALGTPRRRSKSKVPGSIVDSLRNALK